MSEAPVHATPTANVDECVICCENRTVRQNENTKKYATDNANALWSRWNSISLSLSLCVSRPIVVRFRYNLFAFAK